MRQNFAVQEGDGDETIAAKVRAELGEIGLDPQEWGPILLLFFGAKEGIERLAALTPEAIKARTFDLLRQLSLVGSCRQPLILATGDTGYGQITVTVHSIGMIAEIGDNANYVTVHSIDIIADIGTHV